MYSEQTFSRMGQKMQTFPNDIPCKNANFWQRHVYMTLPKLAIFTIRVYGEILCLLSDPTEISHLTT